MEKQYIFFSKDLRKKFLIVGLMPIIIISIFLFGKIYFIIDDMSEQFHTKILKDIDFYTGELLKRISKESIFLQKNFNSIDLKKSLLANNDIDTMIIFDKKTGKIIKLVSDLDMDISSKNEYIKNNPFSKYKNIKVPTYNTIHKAINKTTTISYTIPTDKYIFVFDINLSALESFIDYIKKDTEYIVVVVDQNGNYIYNKSKYPYFKNNFFKTEYYEKIVKINPPLQYEEFYNEEQEEDNFVVYYKSPTTKWTIVTIEDSDTLDDKVLSLLPFVLILLPLLLISILTLSKQFTKNIITPLEILIDKMEKLSKKATSQKINLNDVKYVLFKRMIDSFNTMQELIYKREQELIYSNELLSKKTKEISLLNEGLQDKIEKEIQKNREKDQQLIQQNRLAQMGEMISMIAHQWRQPLAAISSSNSLLALKVQMNKEVDSNLILEITGKISTYLQHLSTTIDNFRDFFKPNRTKQEVTYATILDGVFSIIETSLINNDIKIIKELNSNIVFKTYPNDLIQVILNIIKNAKDALLERDIKNRCIKITTDENILTISDNAGGISDDIIDKIFDPYFTTKDKKNGTGLGLYMSKMIIQEHCEGKLTVENSADGASFKIVL